MPLPIRAEIPFTDTFEAIHSSSCRVLEGMLWNSSRAPWRKNWLTPGNGGLARGMPASQHVQRERRILLICLAGTTTGTVTKPRDRRRVHAESFAQKDLAK